jgi:NAD(P)-dependent dehydrogenase (short-subunit alcohol dehydrogenase family)
MTPGNDAGGRTRTALVTGGTGGMRRVIAARLAADGFDVAVMSILADEWAASTKQLKGPQGCIGDTSQRT